MRIFLLGLLLLPAGFQRRSTSLLLLVSVPLRIVSL
jgi:hypothetical protein